MSDADERTLVQYEFGLPDGSIRSFSVEVGPDRVDSGPAEPPSWAALDFHKCPHCPLDAAEEPFCPAAMSIASLAEAVDGLWSYDMVSLKVRTPERFYSFTPVSLQGGLQSLMGLVLPTSGCPHTAFFRPMARFHVPLATVQENAYRVASMYMLGQWIRQDEGAEANFDFDGLNHLYDQVKVVNHHLHKRLEEFPTDVSKNAVALLYVLAQMLPRILDDSLAPIRPLFASYFAEDEIT